MCGFVGFANFEKNISQEKDLLQKMNNSISRRGPDEQGYYIDKNVQRGTSDTNCFVIESFSKNLRCSQV